MKWNELACLTGLLTILVPSARAQEVPAVESMGTYQANVSGADTPVVRAERAVVFTSPVTVNVDGSPNAYTPDDTGLDYICNAGAPVLDGRVAYATNRETSRACKASYRQARTEGFGGPTRFKWWGVVALDARGRRDQNGAPVVQGTGDPSPGSYVSTTSLQDKSQPSTSPARYVDSERVPYLVLPRDMYRDVVPLRLGDLAVVHDPSTDTLVPCVFADVGPAGHVGEGSVALLRALGHEPVSSSGRAVISLRRPVTFVVFGGSTRGWPLSPEELEREALGEFEAWGGRDRLRRCLTAQ